MDIMSLVGTFLAPFLIIFGIVFVEGQNGAASQVVWTNIFSFINYPSMFITVGGTFAVLMISYPLRYFTKLFKHLKIVFLPKKYNPYEYIDQIVEFAKEARMKGLLSLEDKLNQTEDKFLRESLMLVVDSVEPDKVKQLLNTELEYLDDRHAQDRSFYEKGAAYAPAFGMLGTLVGLINMLKDMTDPSKIGPAMGVALITTFYGSLLANVFFLPIANKLAVRHEEEYLCKMLVAEGVQAIQAGENPKFISEKLTQLLPSYMTKKVDGEGGEAAGEAGAEKPAKGKRGKK